MQKITEIITIFLHKTIPTKYPVAALIKYEWKGFRGDDRVVYDCYGGERKPPKIKLIDRALNLEEMVYGTVKIEYIAATFTHLRIK